MSTSKTDLGPLFSRVKPATPAAAPAVETLEQTFQRRTREEEEKVAAFVKAREAAKAANPSEGEPSP